MSVPSYGNQLLFVRWFAYYAGMNGNVILAWALQEQPPGHPATPGSNNWLNIQYTDSGPNETYYRIARLAPKAAAKASVEWMRHNQPSIVAAHGKSAYDQAKAIVDSGWASSHYGGVAAFYAVVQSVSKGGVVGSVSAPGESPAEGAAGVTGSVEAGGGNPPDHSHKTKVSGEKLGKTGSHFQGHARAMRNLAGRTLSLKG